MFTRFNNEVLISFFESIFKNEKKIQICRQNVFVGRNSKYVVGFGELRKYIKSLSKKPHLCKNKHSSYKWIISLEIMWAPRSHCFSSHMNNRHLWQLKKSKSLGPFWSYQLKSTANPAHSTARIGPNGLNWQCCLADSSKTAPRISIFSIAMGAKPSF